MHLSPLPRALLCLAFASGSVGCISAASAPTRILSSNREWSAPVAEPMGPSAIDEAPVAAADQTRVVSSLSPHGDELFSASDARCPGDMALVADRVCVDRWEASLVERVDGVGERSWPPYLPIEGHESALRAISQPNALPQGYISGSQAKTMCRASGKRLCGAEEWETACRGPSHTQFPYGDRRRAHACNDDIRPVHPVAEVGVLVGLDPELWWSEGMNNPLINQLVGGLLKTGEREDCTNAYGVFDMVGNLHEWIDDREGTFRGGYYLDTTLNGDGCSYQTTAHNFDYHDYSTGFRCCMDPDRVE